MRGEGRGEERYFRKACSSPSWLLFHLYPGTERELLAQELVSRLPQMAEVSPPAERTGFSESSSCPLSGNHHSWTSIARICRWLLSFPSSTCHCPADVLP